MEDPDPMIEYFGELDLFLTKGAIQGLKNLATRIGGQPIMEAFVKADREKNFFMFREVRV